MSLPDQWTLLLAVLSHQARLIDDLPLPAALVVGKRRLAAGDWFDDIGSQLQAVLQDPLRRVAECELQPYWTWLCEQQTSDTARRARFAETAVPMLLGALDLALSSTEIGALHEQLREHGPETLAAALAAELARCWPSRPRVPPEPHLGTLTHGLVVFGEAA